MAELIYSRLPIVTESVIRDLSRKYIVNDEAYRTDLNETRSQIERENTQLVGIIDGSIRKFDEKYYKSILELTILMYRALEDAAKSAGNNSGKEGFTASGMPILQEEAKSIILYIDNCIN